LRFIFSPYLLRRVNRHLLNLQKHSTLLFPPFGSFIVGVSWEERSFEKKSEPCGKIDTIQIGAGSVGKKQFIVASNMPVFPGTACGRVSGYPCFGSAPDMGFRNSANMQLSSAFFIYASWTRSWPFDPAQVTAPPPLSPQYSSSAMPPSPTAWVQCTSS
jgi:hypothetical protein